MSVNFLRVLCDLSFVLKFNSEQVVIIIISFIQEAGFVIWTLYFLFSFSIQRTTTIVIIFVLVNCQLFNAINCWAKLLIKAIKKKKNFATLSDAGKKSTKYIVLSWKFYCRSTYRQFSDASNWFKNFSSTRALSRVLVYGLYELKKINKPCFFVTVLFRHLTSPLGRWTGRTTTFPTRKTAYTSLWGESTAANRKYARRTTKRVYS